MIQWDRDRTKRHDDQSCSTLKLCLKSLLQTNIALFTRDIYHGLFISEINVIKCEKQASKQAKKQVNSVLPSID